MVARDKHGGASTSSGGEGGAAPEQRLRAVPWEALEGLEAPICAALEPVLAGAPAERALDKLLRAHRAWSRAQRQAAAEAIFGVALWRRRLAAEAGLATWEGADVRVLLRALVHLGGAGGPPLSLCDRYSLPDWLGETLQRELGEEAATLAAALCTPGPVFLRANTLLCTREALGAELAREGIATRPGRLAPHALVVESARPNLLGSAAQARGWFEAQDEGSQLLGALLEARPGDTVLDACAGAGGKTLQLAAALQNDGRVVAVDPDAGRLARLSVRARRASATCIELAGGSIPPGLRADRVLVDAPCSELGALRRGPDARWRLQPRDFAALPALQRRILEEALGALRPGGRLVYATCTLRREENEDVARAFEAAHPELRRLQPCVATTDPTLVRDGFFRALPHLHGTDGFFAAVWHFIKAP